ncbi:MAG: phosphotransacetylase family protein [Clostridia bacterium]|nr:MAG: phosphotransacetylase family protein [Clostridia bacterium]
MRNLYIMGPTGSGKTAVGVALALKLKEQGVRVAYFKPVGAMVGEKRVDEDAVLMREVLGMSLPLEEMVLFDVGSHYLSRYEKSGGYLERVAMAHRSVAAGADVVIIGGAPSPYSMASLGLDAGSVAGHLGASVLLVQKVINDLSLDLAIAYNQFVRFREVPALGTILNHVPRALWDKARGVYAPLLEDQGYQVLGIIPQRADISAPTVAEFHDLLGGEILAGEDKMEQAVEDVVIGAMTLESALRYFRRALNKAVITGGDRADLALAALETSTSVIVLTGGLYPDVKVINRAREKGVPLLLVSHDTYSVINMLQEVTRKIRPGDQRSLKLAVENLERYCNWQAIVAHLKL